jgi:FkbM family methyltransferase
MRMSASSPSWPRIWSELKGRYTLSSRFRQIHNRSHAISSKTLARMLFSTKAQCRANRVLSTYSCRMSLSIPGGLRSFHSDRRRKELRVPAIALDDYVSRVGVRSPDVIKIDIEGAEPRALAGMGALIQSEGAPDIAVKINSYLLQRSGLHSDAITIPLAQAGYALFRFEEKGLRPCNPELDGVALIDLYASKQSVMGRS